MMKKSTLGFLLLGALGMGSDAKAALFTLPQLDTSQTDPIFRTLAADFAFRPVEGASSVSDKALGFTFGFSVSGVDTSAVKAIFSELPVSLIPMADLQLGFRLPGGLSIETGFLPAISYSGTSFSKTSVALKWTANKSFPNISLFQLAARFGYSNGNLSSSQQISGVDITVTYGTTVITGNLIASRRFAFFEPYIGLGVANQVSTLSGTGSATLFGQTFPAGTQSFTSSSFSIWPQVGAQFVLYFFALGLEYDNMFGLSSYNTKISFRF